MNPYHQYAASFAGLILDGKSLPLGGIPPHNHQRPLPPDAPVGLIFSPHPDDECIIGGYALRLMRESGIRIINVAVTQGSNKARQQARLLELRNACNWLGFGLEQTAPDGLEKVYAKTRTEQPDLWTRSVSAIAASLVKHQPKVILFPHELDWNGTHIGTHFLVMDALKMMPSSFQCNLVETEFWGQMQSPNLMVESSVDDVADMLAALSFHVDEVKRNPYHLRMPPWMQDNVRRGAELVGGQGGAAPDYMFATLYRLRLWQNGAVKYHYTGGKQISVLDDPATVLA